MNKSNQSNLLLNALALIFILAIVALFYALTTILATARMTRFATPTCPTGTSIVTSLDQFTTCENERLALYLPDQMRWLLRGSILASLVSVILQAAILMRAKSAFRRSIPALIAQLILFIVLGVLWLIIVNPPTISQVVRVFLGTP